MESQSAIDILKIAVFVDFHQTRLGSIEPFFTLGFIQIGKNVHLITSLKISLHPLVELKNILG